MGSGRTLKVSKKQHEVSDMCCSVTKSCLTLCDLMDCSTPGSPVHRQLPQFAQAHVHRVSDAIQPSHPLSSPSPTSLNLPEMLVIFIMLYITFLVLIYLITESSYLVTTFI